MDELPVVLELEIEAWEKGEQNKETFETEIS
jgi:hypothetical protein